MTRLRPPVFAKYIALSARLNNWEASAPITIGVASRYVTDTKGKTVIY